MIVKLLGDGKFRHCCSLQVHFPPLRDREERNPPFVSFLKENHQAKMQRWSSWWSFSIKLLIIIINWDNLISLHALQANKLLWWAINSSIGGWSDNEGLWKKNRLQLFLGKLLRLGSLFQGWEDVNRENWVVLTPSPHHLLHFFFKSCFKIERNGNGFIWLQDKEVEDKRCEIGTRWGRQKTSDFNKDFQQDFLFAWLISSLLLLYMLEKSR